ncbi:unannotated protein [freshwater metagenome]|uniref:Unannotated protein n=1 Tax=freshwater metagenome TaxID=449393 RepID=A0A6J6BLF6_9ZZZZ
MKTSGLAANFFANSKRIPGISGDPECVSRSMTISWGVITPIPTLSVTLSSARADSRCAGIALSELGVTCSHKSADRRIESTMSVDARTLPGLAIAKFVRRSKENSRTPLKPTFGAAANLDKRIGCKVTAARIDTRGRTKQARPIDRTNGTGTNNKVAKPNATVNPEITAVRPAVFIVCAIGSSLWPSSRR